MSNIRREFYKMLFQKRTYIGWAGLFIVPFLVTVAVRFSDAGQQHGPDGPEAVLIQLMRGNGLFSAVATLGVLTGFFLPLLASMSGSYTIAGEAESGTLRTVLIEPVSRGPLLLAKWLVANIYMAIGMALLSVASLIIGSAIFGAEPMQLLSGGTTISVGQGLLRIAASYAFVLVGMAAVVSLATLFSTLANSSLTAVFGALVLVIVMQVLGSFSVFDFLEPYLITSHFDAWQNLLRHPIVWEPMWKGLINFVVWIVGTTGLGYVVFQRKDVLT